MVLCTTLTQQFCKKLNYWFSGRAQERARDMCSYWKELLTPGLELRICHIPDMATGLGETHTCTLSNFLIVLYLNSCGSWSSQESSPHHGRTVQQAWHIQFSTRSFKETGAPSILGSADEDCPPFNQVISKVLVLHEGSIPASFSLRYLSSPVH